MASGRGLTDEKRTLPRRSFLLLCATTITATGEAIRAGVQGDDMYGLIGKIIAAPGRREELITILLNGTANMPGCLSYVVSQDPNDANAIWITEVWDGRASHEASLSLPSVKEAIAKGRPLISSFGERIVTIPVGGIGLARPGRR
jgi:quinol monooxygenase YgiN